MNVLNKLEQCGIVAVVRGNSKKESINACKALIDGGINGIEITFTIPQAEQVIAEIAKQYAETEVVVGAGTVLDSITARIAILAGAQFIVSPCFDQATAQICNLYQVPYMPGCMTITEVQQALKYGSDIIKLFPGSFCGPAGIQVFKAPFPDLNVMPTGGVNLENMADWFAAGAVAVGVGGNLLASAATGDFATITKLANQYVTKYQMIKG